MVNIGVGDVLSFLALIISAYSMKKTFDFNKRQEQFIEVNDRLNKKLLEKENEEDIQNKQADISANFYKSGKSDWRLKVFNKGKATARNVRLVVLDDADLLNDRDIARKFPHPILEQYQSVEILAYVHMQSADRTHIKLIWDDPHQNDNEKELTPSL